MHISHVTPRQQGGFTRLRVELNRPVKVLHRSLQEGDDDINEENSCTSESESTMHSLQLSLLYDVHNSNRTLSPQLLKEMLSSHALHDFQGRRRRRRTHEVGNGMKSPAARQRDGAERLSKAGLQRQPEEKRTTWCGRALPAQPRQSNDHRLIPEQGALGVRMSPVKGSLARFLEGPKDVLRADTERAHCRGLRSLDFRTAHRSHRKFDASTKRATVLGAPSDPETITGGGCANSRFVNTFNRYKAGEADYATAVPGFRPTMLRQPHELAIMTDGGGASEKAPAERSASGEGRAVWYRSG